MTPDPFPSERVADRIAERSIAAARADGVPDWLDGDDGSIYVPAESRNAARTIYAAEMAVPYVEVHATREWMCVDEDAIRDRASDIASDVARGYTEDGPDLLAYTYEDYGWMWRPCKRTAPHAVGFWLCKEVPRA